MLRLLFLAIAMATSFGARASCWNAPDNSGGRGSHIGFSAVMGIASAGYFRDRAWYEQAAIAMVPGVLKEIKDCNTSGLISRRDLLNDALGVGIGVALANGALFLEARRSSVRVSYAIPLN